LIVALHRVLCSAARPAMVELEVGNHMLTEVDVMS
jgi:hypothetical protein